MRKFFITFGNEKFAHSRERLKSEVEAIGLFDHIIAYTEADLMADTEFWEEHGEFIINSGRGYGFWLWKSYLTKKTLEIMENGDILCYADAGCSINIPGLVRFYEYFEMLKSYPCGNISFQLDHIERKWIKGDLAQALGAGEHIHSRQILGGVFLLIKNSHTIQLVNEWYRFSSIHNLIDDSPSKYPNHPGFIENRHDQAIFSILRKKYGTILLEDEVDFKEPQYPIWASRIRK